MYAGQLLEDDKHLQDYSVPKVRHCVLCPMTVMYRALPVKDFCVSAGLPGAAGH